MCGLKRHAVMGASKTSNSLGFDVGVCYDASQATGCMAVDSDIVERMRAEEADLTRKLVAVRGFLAAYGEGPMEAPVSTRSFENVPAAPRPPKRDTSGRSKVGIDSFTQQSRISVLVSMLAMTTSTQLMKTKQLVEFVEAMGHTVSGDNKVNALGALLSRSADIISHGKSGWELADREKALQLIEQNRSLIGGSEDNDPPVDIDVILGGPEAGKEGAPPPTDPWINPSHSPGSTS